MTRVSATTLRTIRQAPRSSPTFAPRLRKRWDLVELDARVRESQRRRRLVDAASSKGKIQAWDFQPFRDASKQYVRNSIDLDDLEAMARFPAGRARLKLDSRKRADGHGPLLSGGSNKL